MRRIMRVAAFLMLFVPASVFGQAVESGAESRNGPQLQRRPDTSHSIESIPGVQCVTFSPDGLTEGDIKKGPRLKSGHWLLDEAALRRFKDKGRSSTVDTTRILNIIQHFRMDASCWIDDPLDPFHFMLSDGKAPVGNMDGETCLHHSHLKDFRVRKFGRGKSTVLRITDGGFWMFQFGSKESADTALAVMWKYGFIDECYGGIGGTAAFNYFTAR